MLEAYPSPKFDPGDPETTILFEVKRALPLGWFLFFEVADFKRLGSRHDESDYTLLVHERSRAAELARARLSAIEKHCSADLCTAFEGLIGSVAASKQSTLVLNSHRLEASRAELTAPIKWIESLAKKGLTERLVDSGNDLFDDCEGVFFEADDDADDEDALVVKLGEVHGVTGWPISAKKTRWYEKLTGPQPTAAEETEETPRESASALLLSVWSKPDEDGVREVCADALTEAGDPRGEFISLQCLEDRSEKQDRRMAKLLQAHRASFSLPFQGEVSFRRGFADEVQWSPTTADDPLVGHPAWSTVRTLEFSGPVALLDHPSLAHVARLRASSSLVSEMAASGVQWKFRSIAIRSSLTDEDRRAFSSLRSFPGLVEVCASGEGFGGFILSMAGQRLVEARRELNVRLRPMPLKNLAPLSAEEHAERLRWWVDPPGKFLAGPRFDDGWR